MMPKDLSPWYTVYQQTQRWMAAGVFEDMVQDLRALLRLAHGKAEQPSAAIFDGRTLQSTRESAKRAQEDAPASRIELIVVKLLEAKKGFVPFV
jgi:transposase